MIRSKTSKQGKLRTAVQSMLRLYRNMKSPDDPWLNHAYLQGVCDCLSALVHAGVLKDFDLCNYTAKFTEVFEK